MLDSLKEKCLLYCYWLGDSLKRVLVIVSVSAFAISVAVFLYGLLYWAVLPSTALAIPVRFTFSSCDVLGEPCSYITSRVKLKKDKLQPGHRYNLELLLDVPDSQANRDLGMFLTCTRLIPEHPSQLPPSTSTCSSSVVPFKASLVSLVESLVLLPLHMAGLATSNSLVSISLLEDHQEDRNSPSTALELELQTSRLQIQAGVLKIWTNDLVGIRYQMYHHPKASMVMGVTSILTVWYKSHLAQGGAPAPRGEMKRGESLGPMRSRWLLACAVLTTKCAGVDTANFEFAFLCVDEKGTEVKHTFGDGGFLDEEAYDTEVQCATCSPPEAEPSTHEPEIGRAHV